MINKEKRIIGLTGGIATGKTTVSNYLSEKYQLPVLDADVYSKEAVQTGFPILEDIVSHFGDCILLPDKSLNRSALGDIIFNDLESRKWLESKIHPYVRNRFSEEFKKINEAIIIFSIPLLFEANLIDLVTEIWVVTCDRAIQLQRLQQRNNLTIEQANSRINSQMPLSEKVARADVVIENNSTLENLYKQCDSLINTSY